MEVPETFRGMKKVKEYPNFVLYENDHYKECFSYYDLGRKTVQIVGDNMRTGYRINYLV